MIYTFGCSFTSGSELPDHNWDSPSKEAWPGILSELIAKPIINKGRAASGNTRIVKRVIDSIIDGASKIIICWTEYGRIEYADEQGIYDIWPGSHNRKWITASPNTNHRSKLEEYVHRHHNLKYLYKHWLRQIILIQNLCKAKSIPCVMFVAFNYVHEFRQYSICPDVKKLLNEIDLSSFIDNSLQVSTAEWTYGTPKMPLGHPGPEGHQKIANKVYEHIRNLGWVS